MLVAAGCVLFIWQRCFRAGCIHFSLFSQLPHVIWWYSCCWLESCKKQRVLFLFHLITHCCENINFTPVVENNLVFHGLVVLADHWVGSENVENGPSLSERYNRGWKTAEPSWSSTVLITFVIEMCAADVEHRSDDCLTSRFKSWIYVDHCEVVWYVKDDFHHFLYNLSV